MHSDVLAKQEYEIEVNDYPERVCSRTVHNKSEEQNNYTKQGQQVLMSYHTTARVEVRAF